MNFGLIIFSVMEVRLEFQIATIIIGDNMTAVIYLNA